MIELYYIFVFFIFGIFFGSFYNVVGHRLPMNESIIYPPSHCPICKKRLSPLELIPILSYIFLLGKCRNCKSKISLEYPLYELLTGMLFALCYMTFGFTAELPIALTFVSAIVIIIISDFNYMIIPDEVIIVFSILILAEIGIISGAYLLLLAILYGISCFAFMYIIKLLGDFLFKKESLGGGDIKLMFLIGIVIGLGLGITSIFIASFFALPISLLVLYVKKTNVIPFGPFLCLGALVIYLLKIDINTLLSLFY